MPDFYRKIYKVRKSTQGKVGMEVTMPAELRHAGVLKPGDQVELLYDNIIVILPNGIRVDHKKLKEAIIKED